VIGPRLRKKSSCCPVRLTVPRYGRNVAGDDARRLVEVLDSLGHAPRSCAFEFVASDAVLHGHEDSVIPPDIRSVHGVVQVATSVGHGGNRDRHLCGGVRKLSTDRQRAAQWERGGVPAATRQVFAPRNHGHRAQRARHNARCRSGEAVCAAWPIQLRACPWQVSPLGFWR
jgi:hypothetical protein